MRTTWVTGGTGPAGPRIANRLVDRGVEVAIVHGGQRHADFRPEIWHIHADLHLCKTWAGAIRGRKWNRVLAAHGRPRSPWR